MTVSRLSDIYTIDLTLIGLHSSEHITVDKSTGFTIAIQKTVSTQKHDGGVVPLIRSALATFYNTHICSSDVKQQFVLHRNIQSQNYHKDVSIVQLGTAKQGPEGGRPPPSEICGLPCGPPKRVQDKAPLTKIMCII